MAGSNKMPPLSEIALGIFLLAVISIIICDLPPLLIDLSISFNITLGIVLLMIALYVQRPLELASFPSIILIGTLFRLALGIASTRAILSKGHAGEAVLAFGKFVTGGNMTVGIVIFIIITIVQFMVITKGSERIAEVSARFALDAMPGKQMTIDSDISQGLIDPETGRAMRDDLQRESSLYGAMDGAMKFVKGDTIAGIMIVIINLIGGLAIGMLQNGMAFEEAANKYAVLTIGDGLSQQLPSLLMAVSSGIIMTRSTSASSSLAKDLALQFMAKPYSLGFAAVFLFLIGCTSWITGLPGWAFFIFAIVLGGATTLVHFNSSIQGESAMLDYARQNMQELVNPNRMFDRLGVDILSLSVGDSLIALADPDQEGQLLAKIAGLRQRITDELGYIIPNIRIQDSTAIGDYEYLIKIRNNDVARGNVYPGRLLAVADQWESSGLPIPKDVVNDVDPTFLNPVYWVNPEDIAETGAKITLVDPTDVMINHLYEACRKYVDEVMTKTDVIKLMELVKSQDPTLINDLVPAIISTSDLRKIFVNLIREKVSIKDIIFIFERLCDFARFSKEPDILSERLRSALGRQICLSYASDKILYAITLSPEWERILDESCQRTELGVMFILNPYQVGELIESTALAITQTVQTIGQQPVILCTPKIRLPLYQLLERHIPQVDILSYSELINDIQVQTVSSIGESDYNEEYVYEE